MPLGRASAGEEFMLRRFSTEDGLPDNNVQAIAQTSDGYLWVGTPNGLVRFDGVKFKTFLRTELPPGTGEAVSGFAVSGQDLWIATNDGPIRSRAGRFTRYSINSGLPNRKIWRIHAAQSGDIWMETDTWPARFVDGRFITYTPTNGLGGGRNLWFAQLDNDELGVGGVNWFRRFDQKEEVFKDILIDGLEGRHLTTLDLHGKGDSWAGTTDGLLWRHEGKWQHFGGGSGLEDLWISFIHRDRSGALWVGTRHGGLHRWINGRFETFKLDVRLQDNGVRCLTEDLDGNLWVGTSEGLIRISHQRFSVFGLAQGLTENHMRSISAAPDGSIWCGSEGALAQIKDGRVAYYLEDLPEKHHGVRSVFADHRGRVWWTTFGLFELVDGRAIDRTPLLDEKRIFGYGLYQDRQARIWIGTDEGCVSLDESGVRLTAPLDVDVGRATCFLQDRRDGFWIGSKTGLIYNKAHQVRRFGPNDGLNGDCILALHESPGGTIWVGTQMGLHRFDGQRFCPITARDGLAEDWINCILSDDNGFLWLSGKRGIHRANESELIDFASGRTAEVHVLTFGESDGLPSSETGGGCQPAGCRGTDGRLWFPTLRGVVSIDPSAIPAVEHQPKPILEQVVAGKVLIYRDGIDLAPSRLCAGRLRAFEFHYTAPILANSDRVRFRHRLRESGEAWHEVGSDRTAYFPNINHGNYTFQVQAATAHGPWSVPAASFAFSVEPRFAETIWFPISLGSAGAGCLAAFGFWRLKWQRRILLSQTQAEIESDRSRIARDLHDHLGANLTGIALQIDVARARLGHSPDLAEKLDNVAQQARDAVDQIREAIWTLNPECDSSDSFVSFICKYAERYLGTTGLRCRLSVAQPSPLANWQPEVRHAAHLAVKETLNNVAKHSGATEVRLSFACESGVMTIVIEDNGLGAQIDLLRGSTRGIDNIRRRIESVGGQFTISSQPGSGVRIEIRLPQTAPQRTSTL